MQRSADALVSSRRVSSQPVQVLDSVTLLIPEFYYDGSGKEVYFWVGSGPYSQGRKIPDEAGYQEPLGPYSGYDVPLRLPGGLTVADVDWLAVYDAGAGELLAAVQLPADAPATPVVLHPHRPAFRNCKQLDADCQISWEVIGNTLYIQVNAKMGEEEYISISFSADPHASSVPGAVVTVVYFSSAEGKGFAKDYIVTDKAPCSMTSGEWKGVCELKGGSHTVLEASRVDGLTSVTFRLRIKPDLKFPLDSPVPVTYAIGQLDSDQPAFHRRYSRVPTNLTLLRGANDSGKADDCFPFILRPPPPPARRWAPPSLAGARSLRWSPGRPRRPRRAAARAAPQRAARARRAAHQGLHLHAPDSNRQRPSFSQRVPPTDSGDFPGRRTGAAQRRGTARSASVGGSVHAQAWAAAAHGRGTQVRRRKAPRRRPAARLPLPDLRRVRPLAQRALRARRARAPPAHARRLLARPSLLRLVHTHWHGRCHVHRSRRAAPRCAREDHRGVVRARCCARHALSILHLPPTRKDIQPCSHNLIVGLGHCFCRLPCPGRRRQQEENQKTSPR